MTVADVGERERRPNALAWLLRIATAAMLVVAIVLAARKFRSSPEQDELLRYAQLTVPGYLDEVAAVEERFERAWAAGGPEARALFVDAVMPQLIKAHKHAESVQAESPSVKALNAEYVAALDRLMEVNRAAVQVIDRPAPPSGDADPERDRLTAQVTTGRRDADARLRAFMAHLQEKCKAAGIAVKELAATVPPGAPALPASPAPAAPGTTGK